MAAAAPEVLHNTFRRSVRQVLAAHWPQIVRGYCWHWVITGAVEGTERRFAGWLYRKVPFEFRDSEELASKVREFTCEAVNLFDHSKGASFNTFLVQHLRQQCGNYQQYLWVRSSANPNCRKLPIVKIKMNGEAAAGGYDCVFEGDRPNFEDFATDSRAEQIAQVRELLDKLPSAELETFRKLLEEGADTEFRGSRFRHRLSEKGYDRGDVDRLCQAIDKLLPQYLEAA